MHHQDRAASNIRKTDIAVIGMSCRFPGAANYEAFWENLKAARSSIGEVPASRWDWKAYWGDPLTGQNKSNSRWGGFLEDVDKFDPDFFGMAAKEVERMDPQQRILLELTWACLEDAGIRPSSLSGQPVGVYLGVFNYDYKELQERGGQQSIEAHHSTGTATAIIANRISYYYNFKGPSLPIDTACSSSLSAIHAAIQSLQAGESQLAIAGGINLLLTPTRHISFSKTGMLSPTGSCKTFDDAADGYVRGEGAGLILLKPLEQALADKDRIYGVIKGSAVNHGGKTYSLTYPNPDAQKEVIRKAQQAAGITPATIGYIEAHGTGTPKGDPIELQGLTTAFEADEAAPLPQHYCAISSVKTNVGHLEAAAGIAGVIKVLLAMQHRQLPPLQNFQQLNHRISLAGTPFYLVTNLVPWTPLLNDEQQAIPLRAGVSSFGFGGTNAHVVLEEAPETVSDATTRTAVPYYGICLSAKTPQNLYNLEQQLANWLSQRIDEVSIADISHTLATGREHFPLRTVLVVRDTQELYEQLQQLVDQPAGKNRNTDTRQEAADIAALFPEMDRAIAQALESSDLSAADYKEKLEALALLYLRGYTPNWNKPWWGAHGRRTGLPTYPFTKEMYWVPATPVTTIASNPLTPLPSPSTNPHTQYCTIRFTGQEPFLSDHRVRGTRILPAVACLEIARSAIASTMKGGQPRGAVVCLEHWSWLQPLAVQEVPSTITIALHKQADGSITCSMTDEQVPPGQPYNAGRARFITPGQAAPIDIATVQATCTSNTILQNDAYRRLSDKGFAYGPSHQCLQALYCGDGQYLARLEATDANTGGYGLHPGLLDATLQACLLIGDNGSADNHTLYLPFALDSLGIRQPLTSTSWALITPGDKRLAGGIQQFHIELYDHTGAPCASLKGMSFKQVTTAPAGTAPESTGQPYLLLAPQWQAAPVTTHGNPPPMRRLIVCTPAAHIDRQLLHQQFPTAQLLVLQHHADNSGERFVQQATGVFQQVQQWAKEKNTPASWIQVIGSTADEALLAGLHGLLRTAWLENPALTAQVITTDDQQQLWQQLPAETPAGVQWISYTDGVRQERHWREIPGTSTSRHPWKDRGTYLITGGAGGIGFLVARAIAASVQQPTLVLTGRSQRNDTIQAKIGLLQAAGARVEYHAVDVSDKAALATCLQQVRDRIGPMQGILHCAGVIQDDYLVRKSITSVQQVLAPKVLGIGYLDELTAGQPLDHLILFSSVVGALGNPGQSDYAAANGYLDGWAAWRNQLVATGQRSGHTIAVNWPLWKEGGMQLPPIMEAALLQQWGMDLLETPTALAALYAGIQARETQVMVAPGPVDTIRQQYLHLAPTPMQPVTTTPAPTNITAAAAVDYFKHLLSVTIKRPVDRIDADTAMEAYGIDSILVMQLTNQLETVFGILPKTLFFEYQNIRELTQYFLEKHADTLQRQLQPATSVTAPTTPHESPISISPDAAVSTPATAQQATAAAQEHNGTLNIAIIGLAGRYPQADNLQQFWQHLQHGKDCITEIPLERWDYRHYYDADKETAGKTYSKWGGFINDVDKFDPLYFNISPSEAERMDPQERLFLLTVHEALEDAGYTRQALQGQQPSGLGSQVGVYVGVMYEEYQLFGAQESLQGNPVALWGLPSSIANRVSYYFDLHGPSMAIDTMCSSSLTAIHLACESLVRGKCELAIAGGVNVSIHPNKYLFLSQGRFVSGKGRCESFGTGGDGYVPGEGVGAVLLKPLHKAIEDGDHIYGVIKSTAINHGGKTNGYTVPNPKAQAAVISKAFREAGIDARAISYFEAHGTGTSLGDPIEILGLSKALEHYTNDKQYCSIGSVKSNIGHCESAAGIAGVTKVLLQLRHRQLVPSLHSATLNSHIDFANSPFYVQQQLAGWQRPTITSQGQTKEYPRTAGISSFGAGGANAHIIIEEYVPTANDTAPTPAQQPALILLSAPEEEQLQRQVQQWLQALTPAGLAWWGFTDAQLPAIAYTLQTGREHHACRLALWVHSLRELTEKLTSFLQQPPSNKHIDHTRHQSAIEAATINHWLSGAKIDWHINHQQALPKQSLPTYPFKKERYWIGQATPAALAATAAPSIHPLVHENVSDLSAQRFRVTFTGQESFLADHVVNERKILPAAVQLEMIRAAVRASLPASQQATPVRFHQLRWTQPLVVDTGALTVYIELTTLQQQQELQVTLYSGDVAGADRELYCQGNIRLDAAYQQAPGGYQLSTLLQQHQQASVTGQAAYAAIAGTGLRYGPSLQAIDQLYIGSRSLLARLTVPAQATTHKLLELHPSILDAALQATLFWSYTTGNKTVTTYLPYAITTVEPFQPTPAIAWAYITGQAEQQAHQRLLDISLLDETGATCIRLTGVALATPTANQTTPTTETLLLLPAWKPAANSAAAETTFDEHLIITCGMPHAASALQGQLPGTTILNYPHDRAADLTTTAIQVFEAVKARSTSKGHHLVQVLVPAAGEPQLYAALGGLLRTARKERPSGYYQLISIPTDLPADQLPPLLTDNRQYPHDEEIRYSAGNREVLHWTLAENEDAATRNLPWKNGGVYLITGGAGGLGMLFAQEIARQVKYATIILTGRSALDAGKQASLRHLEQLGARVHYQPTDISDAAAVQQLVQFIQQEYGALHGIIHSAGVVRDSYLHHKQAADWPVVMAAKVDGTRYLDEASRDLLLDCFICFSSVTGALGNAGQADYAVANAFMDKFAEYRNEQVQAGQRKGHTLSLNWPLWAAGGMQVNEAALTYLYDSFGMTPMTTANAFNAFYKAWALQRPRVMIIEGDRTRILEKIVAPVSTQSTRSTASRYQTAPDTRLTEATVQYLRKMLAAILKLSAEKISSTTPLETYGIDSVMVMKMTARLEKTFDQLPKTLFFEYRTLQDLAQYLIQEHSQQLATTLGINATPVTTIEPATVSNTLQHHRWLPVNNAVTPSTRHHGGPIDIAIVGVSGKYPQANTLAEFWHNLCQGKDCITEIPADRWDYRTYFDTDKHKKGKTYSKWGGFLNDVAAFDALFFNISPLEAEYLDPQERLFLQCVQETLEDAGYNRQSLGSDQPTAPANIGVYVGVMYEEYQLYGAQHAGTVQQQALFGNPSSIANRISYYYNFNGPSMAVDTMCSSSLTAIHLACQSILNGECKAAIAGGVNLTIHPNKYLLLAQGRFISAQGRCESFGIGGDGYVPAEGVGAVLLKPLQQALQDGDQVYGVIKATSINHGGRTNGYTVPNPTAQAAVISKAHERAGIDPRTISYLEAHGTGTSLGDPIEIAGLQKAYQAYTTDKQFCAIGSVKSNIGHSESAAGMAGLTKILLQLKHQTLVPSLHAATLNPHIDFANSPFIVQQTLAPWQPPQLTIDGQRTQLPRRAGLSSFGAGGANAHLIIEEYQVPAQPPLPHEPVIILLSAKNEERLRLVASRLVDHLQQAGLQDQHLPQIAHTLQVGREALESRLALIIHTIDALRTKLNDFVNDPATADEVYHGRIERDNGTIEAFTTDDDLREALNKWIARKKLNKLAEFWVKGLPINWANLYAQRPQRISLPAYPFAPERYWVPQLPEGHTPEQAPAKATTTASAIAAQTLLLQPVWKAQSIFPAETVHYAAHYILLAGWPQTVAAAISEAFPAAHIEQLPGMDLPLATRYETASTWLFHLLQDRLRSKPTGTVLIQLIAAASLPDLAGLYAILQTAHAENPRLIGQYISVNDNTTSADLVATIRHNSTQPDMLALRYTTQQREQLTWEPTTTGSQYAHPWQEGHTYLITGGAGGLGLLFAEEIVQQLTTGTVILTGRTPAAQRQPVLQPLQGRGVQVIYKEADTTDPTALRQLIDDLQKQYGGLHGIIHSAGIHIDRYLIQKTDAEWQQVLQPKVAGLLHLDEATSQQPLGLFIVCSSIAGALGNAGQADYAAANAFMDVWAQQRNALVSQGKRQGRTLSINWPLWEEGGMQVPEAMKAELYQRTGLLPLPTYQALQAAYQAIAANGSQFLVLHGDALKMQHTLPYQASEQQAITTPAHASIDKQALRLATIAQLKEVFGQAVKLAPARIDEREEFQAYGLNSVMIVQLNQQLEKAFGQLSKTLFYEYQHLAALADYLLQEHEAACITWSGLMVAASPIAPAATAPAIPSPSPAPAAAPVAIRLAADDNDPIAIIGLSGRYPMAPTLEAFWQNLQSGRDCISEIPADRWSLHEFFQPDKQQAIDTGKSYSKWGGFLEGFAHFDPLFFNISPREANTMDPQERLFLQASWQALEDAAYTRDRLAQQYQGRIGVFAGITKTGFELYGPELEKIGEHSHLRTSFSSVANRVSWHFNLTGPSMPVDTMCSSSLSAIHEACESIRSGACAMALAGGVNLYLHPSNYTGLCSQSFLATDGRCRSFGEGGSGFVPGEGVGVVLLKRLSQAIADGDTIHAIVKATSVNHGGKTSGYTVPNPQLQAALIREALQRAGVPATDMGYIEAHGTGTSLGDPIEITGLTKAFKQDTSTRQYCAIGSVKSNIGHLEAAAGIAGITKIILQIKHGRLVPSLHAEQLNSNIHFEQTPFFVQRALTDWPRRTRKQEGKLVTIPRLAGISSFGAGGSNAHVIIEEYIPPVGNTSADTITTIPAYIVLSARTPAALRQRAQQLLAYISESSTHATPGHLLNIAYTLQTGREQMESRWSVQVATLQELRQALNAFITGQEQPRPTADILIRWEQGEKINWDALYQSVQQTPYHPVRLNLPVYPFEQKSYWLPALLQQAPATPTQWLFTTETWQEQAAPVIDWNRQLQSYAGQPILILYTNEAEANQLTTLLRKLEKPAALPQPLTLHQLPLAGLNTSHLAAIKPRVVLVMGPGKTSQPSVVPVEQDIQGIYQCLQVGMQAAWEEPIHGYYCYETTAADSRLDCTALHGLFLSAMKENPQHVWNSIQLHQAKDSSVKCQQLLKEWLSSDPHSDQYTAIRLEATQRFAWQLTETELPPATQPAFRQQGTYLIAGGMGYIGGELLHQLATRYQANLLILSQGELTVERKQQCDRLREAGASVRYYTCDISNLEALQQTYAAIKQEWGPIHGVINLARRHDSKSILSKTWSSFRATSQAKIQGTIHLDLVTQHEPLDLFILFASIGGYGARGDADYAWSVSYQNAFARYRNTLVQAGTRKGHSVSQCWGPWIEDRLFPESRQKMGQLGLDLITMPAAFPCIEATIMAPYSVIGLCAVLDKEKVKTVLGMRSLPAVETEPVKAAPAAPTHEQWIMQWEEQKRNGESVSIETIQQTISVEEMEQLDSSLVERIYSLCFDNDRLPAYHPATHSDKQPDLLPVLQQAATEILQTTDIDPAKPLQQYGLDSILAMRLSANIAKKLTREMMPKWLLEYPTLQSLAQYLNEQQNIHHGVH